MWHYFIELMSGNLNLGCLDAAQLKQSSIVSESLSKATDEFSMITFGKRWM